MIKAIKKVFVKNKEEALPSDPPGAPLKKCWSESISAVKKRM